MFKIIVGAREVRVIIALEQRLAIARRDLEEGRVPGFHEGVCARICKSCLQLMKHLQIALPDLLCRNLLVIVEDMHGPKNQGIGRLNRRPSSSRVGQTALDRTLDALKCVGEAPMIPPFSMACCKDALIFVNRSWRRKPAAHSGGCPSSVNALRTARQ